LSTRQRKSSGNLIVTTW